MEREALRRAETMRSAFYPTAIHRNNQSAKNQTQETIHIQEPKRSQKPEHSENREKPDKSVNSDNQTNHHDKTQFNQSKNEPKGSTDTEPKQNHENGLFDFLLKDKEATLIIMIIFFLYEDNADPILMMALVYLLI